MRIAGKICAETVKTDRQTSILLKVFSFIILLETCTRTSKIWGDLEKCTNKTLMLYAQCSYIVQQVADSAGAKKDLFLNFLTHLSFYKIIQTFWFLLAISFLS